MITLIAEHRALIKEMACKAFEINADELTEDSKFDEDLGIDSLSVIDLLASLEKTFHIEPEQLDVSRMVTLEAVYELVADAMPAHAASL
jgi:acyl carrier protein